MSLQCPARFLVIPADTLPTDPDRLRAERVAAVCAAPGERAAAEELAETLGCANVTVADLTRDTWVEVLRPVADLHRGETVVVLAATGSGLPDGLLEIGDDSPSV